MQILSAGDNDFVIYTRSGRSSGEAEMGLIIFLFVFCYCCLYADFVVALLMIFYFYYGGQKPQEAKRPSSKRGRERGKRQGRGRFALINRLQGLPFSTLALIC